MQCPDTLSSTKQRGLPSTCYTHRITRVGRGFWRSLVHLPSRVSLEVRPESKDILERRRTSLDPTRLFPLFVKEIL